MTEQSTPYVGGEQYTVEAVRGVEGCWAVTSQALHLEEVPRWLRLCPLGKCNLFLNNALVGRASFADSPEGASPPHLEPLQTLVEGRVLLWYTLLRVPTQRDAIQVCLPTKVCLCGR
jgi:hypothetical protein